MVHSRRFRRRGFTLIEVLVALGIIVLITALALPAILRARKTGFVVRTKADLNAISLALEAYKSDFGDYPRIPTLSPGSGFAVLGNALIAPGGTVPPAAYVSTTVYGPGSMVFYSNQSYLAITTTKDATGAPVPPTDKDHWVPFNYNDFCDGPGFRLRANVTPQGQYTGQVYGPYLAPEKFKMQGLALLDLWGNPILYFPAEQGVHDVSKLENFVWDKRDTNPSPPPLPLYDFSNNYALMGSTAAMGYPSAQMKFMQSMMGDRNYNGHIDGLESPTHTGPYILWSAGSDGVFGFLPRQAKSDDVANFDFPADLRQ